MDKALANAIVTGDVSQIDTVFATVPAAYHEQMMRFAFRTIGENQLTSSHILRVAHYIFQHPAVQTFFREHTRARAYCDIFMYTDAAQNLYGRTEYNSNLRLMCLDFLTGATASLEQYTAVPSYRVGPTPIAPLDIQKRWFTLGPQEQATYLVSNLTPLT